VDNFRLAGKKPTEGKEEAGLVAPTQHHFTKVKNADD